LVQPAHPGRGQGAGLGRRRGLNQAVLRRLREICLALPGAEERLSHETPTWFLGGRQFAQIWDDHHGDGQLVLWCAAPVGAQEAMVEADPERFFRPPYVGHRGWLGVRLDRDLDWKEVAGIVGAAHALIATR
jgi:hypothetical protein